MKKLPLYPLLLQIVLLMIIQPVLSQSLNFITDLGLSVDGVRHNDSTSGSIDGALPFFSFVVNDSVY